MGIMRKNGTNFVLMGLLAGVSVAVMPSVAKADVHGFFAEIFSQTPQYEAQRYEYEREYVAPVRRTPSHSHSVRANALPPKAYVDLRQKNLKPAEEMDAFAAAVHSYLNQPTGVPVRVRSAHVQPIAKFYGNKNFTPLWIGQDGLNDKAKRLLVLLSKADTEGLKARDYLPQSLADFADTDGSADKSPADLARLEVELTAAALEYSHHISAGRVEPLRISELHTIEANPVDPAEVLLKLEASAEPDAYLASLQPLIPQYQYLKTALAKVRNTASTEEEVIFIPGGKLIRAGGTDSRIELVAKRLQQLGYYDIPAEQATEESTFYNPELVAAVKDLQEQSGLNNEGIIGRQTLAALNGQSSEDKISKIIMSMERLRWLPQDLKSRYVFVNQAFFETWMMDEGKEVYRSDVIVGRPKFQTAVFADEMEKVTLNPNWYVPRTIIYEEMIPKLLKNPNYLANLGYIVTDRSGQTVDSSTVDWGRYGQDSIPFDVRQPPGPKNALGKVKFMFPNQHSIYMHDTPARELFKKKVRAFSHGCVRLQKPMEFANIILGTQGWSPEKIQAAIASGENQTIILDQKIPVYLGYYTAWADADGNVKTRNDIYSRDRTLRQALEQNIQARASRKIALR